MKSRPSFLPKSIFPCPEPLEARIAPAFAAVLDLSTIAPGIGVRLDGPTLGDGAGYSVAQAGDVNGDGFADVIIGAPYADENGADSGVAYVIFGKANGIPAALTLPPASLADGFKIKGAATTHFLGKSVSTAGDVNNDSFADVIVGAPGVDAAGSAYVIFGSLTPSAVVEVSALDGSDGLKIAGSGAGQQFGESVSRAGDVNGDGFEDVLIGATGDDDYGTDSGAAYVIYGAASLPAIIDVSSLSSLGCKIVSESDFDFMGSSVAAAGDVNKDGIADIIIGAFGTDSNGSDSGSAYVLFGDSAFQGYITTSSISGSVGFEIRGATPGTRAGFAVSGVGDLNSDSFDDVAVGSPNPDASSVPGTVAVVFGSASISTAVEISALNGANGFTMTGLSGTDRFGSSVSGAGDVNDDGIADLIIGAFKSGIPPASQSGEAYVLFGKTGSFGASFDLTALNGSNGFKITGGAGGDILGRSLSRAGDVDGDGVQDFIVGAPGSSANGAASGAAYVIYGQPMTDIDISFTAGIVAIDDTPGADSNSTLRLIRSGANLRISDPVNILNALAGATQIDARTVEIPFANITGLIGINAGRGDDLLILDYSGGAFSTGTIGFVGGDGNDGIVVEGNVPAAVDFAGTSTTGALLFNSDNVTHSEVENVTDLRAAASRTFLLTDNTNYTITVADQGSGVTDITTSAGLLYRFASPANLLSISGGDAADTITVQTYDPQPLSRLVLSGGAGNDDVEILVPLTLARLDINAENVNPLPSLSLGTDGGTWQTGAFAFSSGTTLGIRVEGDAFSLSSTMVGVTGTINLTGASLRIDGAINGPVSRPLQLIDNDGIEPITGTFSGLAEGAGVLLGTTPYVISYFGGDGNDVTLTRRLAYGSTELSGLNGDDGFVIGGARNGEQLGSAISMLGDVNGDGFDDFAVTAARAPQSGGISPDFGATYVFFGSETPFSALLEVNNLDGTNGFVILGVSTGDLSGSSVSGGGDINGDGLADIVIGASSADPGAAETGAVYVVFGSSAAFSPTLDLSDLNGSDGFRFDGASDGGLFGFAVNASGDVNGDGITDLVVGAPNAGADSRGRAYVLFGSRQPFATSVASSSLNGANGFEIDGEGDLLADFGAAVGTVDVNGDGFDDVVVGDPSFSVPSDVYGAFKGAAYVIFGAATQKSSTTSVKTLNGKTGFKIIGERPFSSLGFAVSGAGDFNNDGMDDLIVGAPGKVGSSVLEQPGSAYVLFGKAKGWASAINVESLNGSSGFEIIGAADTDFAGSSVGSVGDFNGDGIADIIVGVPRSDANGSNSGAAHVLFGRSGRMPLQVNVANINGTNGYSFIGSNSGEHAGTSVAGIGDIDRDGLADIAIGAPLFGDDATEDGRSFMVFGRDGLWTLPVIKSGGTSATFRDADGDEIIVKAQGGRVNADMFTFSPTGDLLLVDLNAGWNPKPGANLVFFVKQSGGDGLLNIGAITGSEMNLGKISITGDIGQIDLTPLNLLKPVLKQLVVGSFGMMGAANQIPGTIDPLVSEIAGSVSRIQVQRNIQLASLRIDGKLGSITIGGEFNGTGALDSAQLASLGLATAGVAGGGTLANSGLNAGSIGNLNIKQSLNNAAVQSGGNIGSASVSGSINKGAIVAGGKIGVVKVFQSITSDDLNAPSVIAARGRLEPKNAGAAIAINSFIVRGEVRNAEILIGYDSTFAAVNPDAGLGTITVKGNWTASSLAVGIEDGMDDGFGQNDTIIPEAAPDSIFARIANIVIGGTVTGTVAGGDSFAITAQRIFNAKIGGIKLALDKLLPDDLLLGGTTDFRLKEIS